MFSKKQQEEHNYWISFTDLVSGFMVIFIVVTIVLIKNVAPQPPITPPLPTSYTPWVENFRPRLEGWEAVQIADSATLRFLVRETSPSPLFQTGDPKPTIYFRSILDRFLPIFFDEVYKLYKDKGGKQQIKEIRIEGHTDSEGNYFDNLKLSSGRAFNVQEYMLQHVELKKYDPKDARFREFLRRNSISCGYSYSRLLDEKGNVISNKNQNEDKEKSRRIELRILLESKNQ